jgi:hypothetical protein
MNWGNKLLITFLVFGAGIGYLVYRSMHTNYELVEKEYYKTELKYQQVIDASGRTTLLSSPVSLKQTSAGILLQLPVEMKNRKIEGEIWFYCSYDSGRDKKLRIKPNDDASQLLPIGAFSPGTYIVKTSWVANGNNYYSENTLTIL